MMDCECLYQPEGKPKAPITGPAQAECIYNRQINSLVVSSSSDAQRIAVLEDKVSGLTAVIVCCVIVSASVFTASFYAVDQSKQRLQRIEKIVGIDEIGRRK